ncbi:hypothetical protein HA402_000922 [Bradysia odoriphaga]|nr:hypothetical protein HA402_000922 [Bradysia odoriphaga]
MSCLQMFLLSVFLIGAILIYQYNNLCAPVHPPTLNLTAYWGSGNGSDYREGDEIQLQKIIYFDKPVKLLKQHLKDVDLLTESLEGVGFEYGINFEQIKIIH